MHEDVKPGENTPVVITVDMTRPGTKSFVQYVQKGYDKKVGEINAERGSQIPPSKLMHLFMTTRKIQLVQSEHEVRGQAWPEHVLSSDDWSDLLIGIENLSWLTENRLMHLGFFNDPMAFEHLLVVAFVQNLGPKELKPLGLTYLGGLGFLQQPCTYLHPPGHIHRQL